MYFYQTVGKFKPMHIFSGDNRSSLKQIHTRKKQGHRFIPLHPLAYGYVLGINQNSSHFKNGLPINKNILPRVKDHLQWH